MVVQDEKIRQEQLDILSMLFNSNTEVDGEFEAHKIICEAVRIAKTDYNLDNFNITTYVKDNTKVKWKQSRAVKDKFVKLFTDEINSAIELFGLMKPEVLFLYSLMPYLLWEENLLVDFEGHPLNQSGICKELDLTRQMVSKYMKSLEVKKCLVRVWNGRSVYYLINPYLMFKGANIHKAIYECFDIIGYQYKGINK